MNPDAAAPEAAPVVEGSYLLRLYVAGVTARSTAAIQAVQHFCTAQLPGRYTLEVIDVHQQPELARSERIVATPTLVKYAPPPVRRLVGGFSSDSRMRSALGCEVKKE
jgi:circadian clock protein KaiB